MPKFCTNCGNALEPTLIRCPACGLNLRREIIQTHNSYIDHYEQPKKEYRELNIKIKLAYLIFYIILVISGFFPYIHYYIRSTDISYEGGYHIVERNIYHEIIGFNIPYFIGAVIIFLISVILLFTLRRVLVSMITGFIGDFFLLLVFMFIYFFSSGNKDISESWLGIGYYLGMLAFVGLSIINLMLIGYLSEVKD